VGLVLVAGCEKSGGDKPSGALAGDETALLQYMPAGSVALFGGNYIKFQNYLANSPLQKLVEKMNTQSPGLSEWMKCWSEELPNLTMMGSLQLKSATAEIRYLMKGIDLAVVERCSTKAKFPTTMEADKKYMSYEMAVNGQTLKGGYLVVADGTLYTRMTMGLGGVPQVASVGRADLDSDLASLDGKTAAMDTQLVAAMADIDRSTAMWFVGSGANTPIADKVGLVKGTFDLANGIALDVRAEMKDSALADKVERGVEEAKKKAGAFGGAAADVIESIKVSRKADWLRFQLSIDNPKLTALIEQITPMLGMLGGR
ncbi:MAG: hypothetical protein ABI175_02845, partial [Polyangiales bacterium]